MHLRMNLPPQSCSAHSSGSSSRTLSPTPTLSGQDEKEKQFSNLSSASSSTTQFESQVPPPPQYHVFTRSRKLQMVYIVSLAAIFSPLSSNIYFPALGTISKVSYMSPDRGNIYFILMINQDLDVSMSLTTLTVTVYMIVQGLAPSFWGSFSDVIGRRAILHWNIYCLYYCKYCLGVSTNYGELMAFRALQAAGSAATISIRRWCHWRYYYVCRERKLSRNFWRR